MADPSDLDVQRIFERFSTAYDKPRRRQRRRLSLFPIEYYPGAGGTSAPTAVLSSMSVAEDAEIGTIIGALSVSNLPDGVTVSSWAVTADPDTKFTISGSNLTVEATFDFETATSHSVTVEATLSDLSTVSRAFTISVIDVLDTSPPVNTVLPAITGTEQVGEVLSVSDGTWTGTPAPTFTYQWTRDTVNISGATANTHTLVEADEGAMIACVVTGTNSEGSDDATATAVGPIIAAPPAGTDFPFSTARSSMYVPVLIGDI